MHKESCLAAQARIKAAQDAFLAKWPNFCKSCWGAGGHTSPGDFYQPPDWQPCFCLDNGRCPLCGKQHNEDWEADECECGWTYDGHGMNEKDIVYPIESMDWCDCFEPTQEELDEMKRVREQADAEWWDSLTAEQKNAWYAESDFQYDCAREKRVFGR